MDAQIDKWLDEEKHRWMDDVSVMYKINIIIFDNTFKGHMVTWWSSWSHGDDEWWGHTCTGDSFHDDGHHHQSLLYCPSAINSSFSLQLLIRSELEGTRLVHPLYLHLLIKNLFYSLFWAATLIFTLHGSKKHKQRQTRDSIHIYLKTTIHFSTSTAIPCCNWVHTWYLY